ncbi:hypothetical protein ACIAD1338 [Acinetobacter baylyi ADP1]|uniref:Uncharacterized protein n=1 Tax=Acinetobacter baylyi (strain ATCC 33305 / BD413 / ADP1) TaxID=62977 RepID=Q6FCK4_ACIAD|nr:hypothetical protein ACIAD1338 [Acinetobacter baylyi ADP1]
MRKIGDIEYFVSNLKVITWFDKHGMFIEESYAISLDSSMKSDC